MSFIKSTVEFVFLTVKTFLYSFVRIPLTYSVENIPYYAQWESQNLVDDIIHKKISAIEDPKWRQSGALTKDEYVLWSWNVCGMACAKMILGHTSKKNIPLITLAKTCKRYGGYTFDKASRNSYEDKIEGLFYKPFVTFLEKEFGYKGKIKKSMNIKEMLTEFSKGKYIIASVNGTIRDPKNTPKERGGHLVLITGYDLKKKTLYIHNPSGYFKKSQKNAEISFQDFAKFYAFKGIVINK